MLAMMVDLEEDEEWAMTDELEEDDFDRYQTLFLFLFLLLLLPVWGAETVAF